MHISFLRPPLPAGDDLRGVCPPQHPSQPPPSSVSSPHPLGPLTSAVAVTQLSLERGLCGRPPDRCVLSPRMCLVAPIILELV